MVEAFTWYHSLGRKPLETGEPGLEAMSMHQMLWWRYALNVFIPVQSYAFPSFTSWPPRFANKPQLCRKPSDANSEFGTGRSAGVDQLGSVGLANPRTARTIQVSSVRGYGASVVERQKKKGLR